MGNKEKREKRHDKQGSHDQGQRRWEKRIQEEHNTFKKHKKKLEERQKLI